MFEKIITEAINKAINKTFKGLITGVSTSWFNICIRISNFICVG
jgi:hypothetical protein